MAPFIKSRRLLIMALNYKSDFVSRPSYSIITLDSGTINRIHDICNVSWQGNWDIVEIPLKDAIQNILNGEDIVQSMYSIRKEIESGNSLEIDGSVFEKLLSFFCNVLSQHSSMWVNLRVEVMDFVELIMSKLKGHGFVSKEFVDILVGYINNRDRDLTPMAVKYLKHYVDFSLESRNSAIKVFYNKTLLNYLISYTSTQHTNSGLLLLYSFIDSQVDDIIDEVLPFLAPLRLHLSNMDVTNRVLSTKCISCIVSNKIGYAESIKREIPKFIMNVILPRPFLYNQNLFGLVALYEDIMPIEKFMPTIIESLHEGIDFNIGFVFEFMIENVMNGIKFFVDDNFLRIVFVFVKNSHIGNKPSATTLASIIMTSLPLEYILSINNEIQAISSIFENIPIITQEKHLIHVLYSIKSMLLNGLVSSDVPSEFAETLESLVSNESEEISMISSEILFKLLNQ